MQREAICQSTSRLLWTGGRDTQPSRTMAASARTSARINMRASRVTDVVTLRCFTSFAPGLPAEECARRAGDARGIEAVLGVETLRVTGLAERRDADALERGGRHLAEELRHRAAQSSVDAVVLHRDHPARLPGGPHHALLVERLDRRHVEDLRVHALGREHPRRL